VNIKERISYLKECDTHYYGTGTALEDDGVYDDLKDELYDIEESHTDYKLVQDYLQQVGAKTVSSWTKIPHDIKMNSLNKVKNMEEFGEWFARVRKQNPNLDIYRMVVQEKLDGLSISNDYQDDMVKHAVTRGDGKIGEDVLENVRKMVGFSPVKKGFNGSLRGEIILRESNFNKLCQKYESEGLDLPANARNAGSGITRRYNGTDSEKLEIVYYDVASSQDFQTETEKYEHVKDLVKSEHTAATYICNSVQDVEEIYNKYVDSLREKLDYGIDGLVVKFDSIATQKTLGESSGRPKGQIAIKFPPKVVTTMFHGVEWNVSRTGRVNPIALLEPVKLDGTTVKRATLHNLMLIEELDLRLGSKVAIKKSGDIIPQIIKMVGGENGFKVVPPKNCPECNSELEVDEKFIWCRNSECKVQLLNRIINYVKTIGIENIAESFITTLFEKEIISDISSLYDVKESDLKGLAGIGDKMIEKYFSEIERTRKMDEATLLHALGIHNIGETVSGLLIDNFNNIGSLIKEIGANGIWSTLSSIDGIGDILSKDIIKGIKSNLDLIQDILGKVDTSAPTQATDSVLTGRNIVLTGGVDLEKSRKVYENMIKAVGGKVGSSVSAKTDYLMTNDPDSGSGKAKKAKELGVEVVSETRMRELLNL
jgi:DNA ligase (NAD+)